VLTKDTDRYRPCLTNVRCLAKKYNADLVVVPYACTIRHFTVRPAGWRKRQYGTSPGYERPISYTAKTEFHVQIWDRRACFCTSGSAQATRQTGFLFVPEREKHPDKDIVKYAKRFYRTPLVKSLYNSIKAAMQVRT